MNLKHLFCAAIIFFLVGCQSTPKDQNAQLLSNSHGYLVVNLPRFHPNVEVTNIATKKKYTLTTRINNTSGLWLPEGEYAISKMGMQSKIKGFPTINVKTGTLTDMGSLIYFDLGDDQEIWIPKRLGNEEQLIAPHIAKYSPYLSNQNSIVWQPKKMPLPSKSLMTSSGQGLVVDLISVYVHSVQEGALKKGLSDELDADQFYNLAIKALPPIQSQIPASDNNQNLYYGAELGVIKKRDAKGQWDIIQTNQVSDIHIVRTLSNGKLLAANEAQQMIVEAPEQWQVVSQFENNEKIQDIDILGDKVYVITADYEDVNYIPFGGKNYTLKVYEFDAGNFASKKEIYSNFRKWGARAHGKIVNNKYYIGLSPELLDVIDLNTHQSENLNVPQKFTNFNVLGEIITLYNQQGAFSDLFISKNLGQTWQELSTPPYTIGSILFESPTNGTAYRIAANLADVSFFLQKYDAQKNKWHNFSEAPRECKFILHDAEYFPRFCVTKSDEIMSYQNKQWSKESSFL